MSFSSIWCDINSVHLLSGLVDLFPAFTHSSPPYRDLVLSEFQIGRAKSAGASGVTIGMSLVGEERCSELVTFCKRLGEAGKLHRDATAHTKMNSSIITSQFLLRDEANNVY